MSGEFAIRKDKKSEPQIRRKRNIGMIAGGTGITPMLQLVRDVLKHRDDDCQLWLLFANQVSPCARAVRIGIHMNVCVCVSDREGHPSANRVGRHQQRATRPLQVVVHSRQPTRRFAQHATGLLYDPCKPSHLITGWTYSSGFVSEDMIKEHLPEPSADTLILMCGPPPMIKFACLPNLDKLGYTEDMYFAY